MYMSFNRIYCHKKHKQKYKNSPIKIYHMKIKLYVIMKNNTKKRNQKDYHRKENNPQNEWPFLHIFPIKYKFL